MTVSRREFVAGLTAGATGLVFALAPAAARAADPVFATGSEKLAIRGTDPVAYFKDGKPVAGSTAHTSTWNGAQWRFASAANKAAFDANPEAYAPRFGGYCAWAVAEGYTAPVDPEAFRIVDGKLYLNYSKAIQTRWESDIPGNIARAEANWPKVLNR